MPVLEYEAMVTRQLCALHIVQHVFYEKEMTSIDLDRNVPVSRDPIPVRIMTSQMVSKWYPEVPHEWVCDGKLLMLTDPHHPNNISLFQGKL